ncbi:MAG: hypothetical protein R3C59_28825 [Planctomycetaceae bacterium]
MFQCQYWLPLAFLCICAAAAGQDAQTLSELVDSYRRDVPRCTVLSLEFEDSRTSYPPIVSPRPELVRERFGFWSDGERVAVRGLERSYSSGGPKFVFSSWGSNTQDILYLEDRLAPDTVLLHNHPQRAVLLGDDGEYQVHIDSCELSSTLDPWDLLFNPGLGNFLISYMDLEESIGEPFKMQEVEGASLDDYMTRQFKGSLDMGEPAPCRFEITVSIGRPPFGIVASSALSTAESGGSMTIQRVSDWRPGEGDELIPVQVERTVTRDGSVVRELKRSFQVASTKSVNAENFVPENFYSEFSQEVVVDDFEHLGQQPAPPKDTTFRFALLVINLVICAIIACWYLFLKKRVPGNPSGHAE